MKTFTAFDKQNLSEMRNEIDELLSVYGAQMGLQIKLGNASFTTGEVNFKLNVKINGAKSKLETDLDQALLIYGLSRSNSFGDELVGFDSKKRKSPFIFTKKSDGNVSRYVCSVDMAERFFKKA